MSKRIYCYTDISTLSDCTFYEEIKSLPQVTVSSDLRKGINGKEDLFALKAIDLRQLLDLIAPDWTTDITKFQESVVLSEYIRDRIQTCKTEEDKQWLIGCRRNLNAILSTIILLEEAGVLPSELPTPDKNFQLFVEAWKYLIGREASIDTFRKEMEQLKSKKFLDTLIKQLFQRDSVTSIVIHGFYYFTPIQRRVFDALEKQGYSLIYLIPYDMNYPFVNEIWEKTYAENNGYPGVKEWTVSNHQKDEPIAEIFEGKKVSITDKLRVLEYGSIIEFVNDIKRSKDEGYSIYAANYNQANSILKDFFPEEYGERKLLSYPIGQFVYTLNKMWNEDEQMIRLEEESIRQCFSSGWLSTEGVSSKKYMQDLEYILPFFANCETVQQWNNRISLLENIYNKAITSFSSKVSESPEADVRWQKVYNNPFNNFSIFAVKPERLNSVIILLTQLIEMAETLFGKSGEVELTEHIKKLDHLLKRHEKSQDLYTEEREIVHELFRKLESDKDEVLKCFPSDIANAMTLFLDGSFEDEETRSRGAGMVYPLYQIDAAPIKNNSKVHICLCDVNNMPGKTKDYVWPLTSEVVEKCFYQTNNKYIKIMMQVMESAPICNRYFIYSALKNKDVELSWINNMNGKLLSASPYIRLLCSIGEISIDTLKNRLLSSSKISEIEISARKVSKYQIIDKSQHVAKESMMDYALCPMRYVFGYVLDEYPTYQGIFLHNYAINGLVTAVYYLMKNMGISQSEIEEEVLELFPNLRAVEKRQIKDYLSIEAAEKNTDLGMRTEYADVSYTDERLKVKFPYKKVREEAKKKYGELMTPAGRNGINLYEPTDVKAACVFCQHADYCRNAIFALDQEDYYD